jgi:hypothetical protein
MRLPGLLAVMALFGASCTTLDPAPIYIDMNYEVRCGDCQPRTVDDPQREIKVLDGERGYTLKCDVNTPGGQRQISFSAEHLGAHTSDAFKLSVEQAYLDGKDPGQACKVRVTEGGNTYVGGCTGGSPTAANPCQISFTVDAGIVKGSFWCKALPNGANSTTTRDVVTPGSKADAIKFEVDGCTGL